MDFLLLVLCNKIVTYLTKLKQTATNNKLYISTCKAKKMFFMHCPYHCQPPVSKIFIAFPLINMKKCPHITNNQFNLTAFQVCIVGWFIMNYRLETIKEQ